MKLLSELEDVLSGAESKVEAEALLALDKIKASIVTRYIGIGVACLLIGGLIGHFVW